jgi:hypothetical protein
VPVRENVASLGGAVPSAANVFFLALNLAREGCRNVDEYRTKDRGSDKSEREVETRKGRTR